MKILAGHARGRMVKTPPRDHDYVRPILGRIKKSLFDILNPRMAECNFLDLYAETGSVGLEALSRGAARTTFVEQDRECLKLIQDNSQSLKFENRSNIVRGSAIGDLSFLPKPFDIIFMGPPYKNEQKTMLALTLPTILNIEKYNLLAGDGLLVCQHHKTEKVESPSPLWEMVRREKYGDSVLSFFKWKM